MKKTDKTKLLLLFGIAAMLGTGPKADACYGWGRADDYRIYDPYYSGHYQSPRFDHYYGYSRWDDGPYVHRYPRRYFRHSYGWGHGHYWERPYVIVGVRQGIPIYAKQDIKTDDACEAEMAALNEQEKEIKKSGASTAILTKRYAAQNKMEAACIPPWMKQAMESKPVKPATQVVATAASAQ